MFSKALCAAPERRALTTGRRVVWLDESIIFDTQVDATIRAALRDLARRGRRRGYPEFRPALDSQLPADFDEVPALPVVSPAPPSTDDDPAVRRWLGLDEHPDVPEGE